MPTLDVYNLDKQKTGEIELDDSVFGADVNESLIYEYVKMQMARRRRGTHKTKGRSEVNGGGKKPFRQKGTGRARQGSTRAPQWAGGGTVHGPQPRSYAFTMPRSARRGAIRSSLSLKVQEGQLIIVDDFSLPEIKTKLAAKILKGNFGLDSALIIGAEKDETLNKSVRNLHGFKVLASEGLNVRDVLRHKTLIVTRPAVEAIQEKLS